MNSLNSDHTFETAMFGLWKRVVAVRFRQEYFQSGGPGLDLQSWIYAWNLPTLPRLSLEVFCSTLGGKFVSTKNTQDLDESKVMLEHTEILFHQ